MWMLSYHGYNLQLSDNYFPIHFITSKASDVKKWLKHFLNVNLMVINFREFVTKVQLLVIMYHLQHIFWADITNKFKSYD